MSLARDRSRPNDFPRRAALTLCGLALLALPREGVLAQDHVVEPFDLVGTVVDDATGRPLVGAFVSFEGSEWGSVTNERGRFHIPEVYEGPAILTVEQLGYEELSWRGELAPETGAPELRVTPKPILLEGLRVVADRFEFRRLAVATSSRAFDRDDLATATDWTLLDFVSRRVGSPRVRCGSSAWGDECLRVRGRAISPTVYVDEAPLLGGLDYLDMFAPHEVYRLEIFGRGGHIRVYTERFMEQAAEVRLQPIPIL